MSSLHKEIYKEYEKRRSAAEELNRERKAEIISRIPVIDEINEEIRYSGLKYNKLLVLGTDSSSDIMKELLANIEELEKRKTLLMQKAGFPGDYLEQVYQCPKCRDTGFIELKSGSVRCVCYRQMILKYLHGMSNLKATEKENFSTFDETLYSDVVDEAKYGIKISPRQNISYIKQKCFEFIENFKNPETKNLFFTGPTGTGKTFMINCIAAEMLKKGFTVLYQTAPMLYDVINEHRMKWKESDDCEDMGYRYIFKADILIIDDFGTESPSAAKYAELLNIMNTRQANNLERSCKTIITTNVSLKKLHSYYDERIMSRIIGNFDTFLFAGDDIRGIKKIIRT